MLGKILSALGKILSSPFVARVTGLLLLPALLWAGILWVILHFVSGERDQLKAWQGDVVVATRDAAHRPKLATGAVARQVRFLGQGLDGMRAAAAHATATALAAKQAREGADEANRKEADHAAHTNLAAALRSADAYARDSRLRSDRGRPAASDHGSAGSADLSGTGDAAGGADGQGAGPAMVSVPRSTIDTCTTLKVRLDAGHDWALRQGGQ